MIHERSTIYSEQPVTADGHAAAKAPASFSERVQSLRLGERTAERSSPRLAWLPWSLCLVFAALDVYLGYRAFNADPPPASLTAGAVSAGKPAVPVSSQTALNASGYVLPVRRVIVTPKVGGEVKKLNIEEGQEVKEGFLIAELDDTKYRYEFNRLDAQLKEAEEMSSQLKDEATRWQRSRAVAAEEELFRINSRLKQAEYKVEQLRQARDNAKYDLDNTKVIAPISGRILRKQAEVGNTVRPEAFSNGLAASLCEMADVKDMEVDVDVSERDLDRIYLNQECEIRTEAFPSRLYRGKVSRLMPESDKSKASVSVRVHIDVPDDDQFLRPNMRARVVFLAKESK